ncbi:MAG: hypothetical protein WDO73_29270 [Ignavibacteriota bacterium]
MGRYSFAGRKIVKARRWNLLMLNLALLALPLYGAPADPPLSPTNIFSPVSTPAETILGLSFFVLAITGAIFLVVFSPARLLGGEVQKQKAG